MRKKKMKVLLDKEGKRRDLILGGIYKYVFSEKETSSHVHEEYQAINGWRVRITGLGNHYDSVVQIESAEPVPFPVSLRISAYCAAYSELAPYGEVPM